LANCGATHISLVQQVMPTQWLRGIEVFRQCLILRFRVKGHKNFKTKFICMTFEIGFELGTRIDFDSNFDSDSELGFGLGIDVD